MRAISASAALLAATTAAVALGAPAALAAPTGERDVTSFGFSVTPSTIAPGGTVTLASNGCEVPSVNVSSGVFDTVTLNEGHSATAKVDWDAKRGAQYQVTFDCKGEKGTTTLTIAGGSGHDDRWDHNDHRRGVKAGLGGANGGLGTTEVLVGSALIAGALGVVVVRTRRRADGRG
ncbi:hypothetical protein ABT160_42755 [Streptomyces sp. NPDC001941]|uniref:hypothetical protein n=1 Tax=Streptomyces sp. NPDC001941 TaxID=3154659 RepID=UPI003316E5C6